MKHHIVFLSGLILLSVCSCTSPTGGNSQSEDPGEKKHRVIVSSDIGGTDPDDFQSMIHYLMYSDQFETEGIISSPFGEGRKEHILQMIDLYEKDLPKLKAHSDFPEADSLRVLAKQGATEKAPPKGWSDSTEGSEWIIEKAKEESDRPLWILVWGGIEDVAQALHDAPEIAENIRVYWIGGPNKKWARNAYLYIARNFPDLWMIESNATYRGWFNYPEEDQVISNKAFYENHIKGRGALGKDFGNYYEGEIKMGDTPSVAYLQNGDPDDPEGPSWGGSYDPLPYSAFRKFIRYTTSKDTIPTYSVIEWSILASEENFQNSNHWIWMEIDGQRIDGFYEGNGIYKVRFVPKRTGDWKYEVNSDVKELDGLTGEFVSANPWPGHKRPENIDLNSWWSDRNNADMHIGEYQGAKTVSKWRKEYLDDWAERWKWLED